MADLAKPVKRRPAEAAGLAGAVSLLVVRLAGVTDPDLIVAIGVVVGAVPAGITWLVTLVRSKS